MIYLLDYVMCSIYNGTMRPRVFSRQVLATELRSRIVATMPDLVVALGSPSRSTVFRLLGELGYVSSYSHAGRFYALVESARFDADGVWLHRGVGFSSHGTLLATVEALVPAAPLGWRVNELDDRLGVSSIDALRKLVREDRLASVKVSGRALYCSANPARRRRQQTARLAAEEPPPPLPQPRPGAHALATAITRFASLLNEKQRRLFAGVLSLLYGRGGDRRAAAWVGLTRKTVRKGRHELASGPPDAQRVRQPGGGRKPLEKKSLR